MKIKHHPYSAVNWKKIPKVNINGEKGTSWSRTLTMGDIRIRMVKYAKGYLSDHWCKKGHVIYCIKGSMISELKDGKKFKIRKGMSYHVGDDSDAHRSSTMKGCLLFIVD